MVFCEMLMKKANEVGKFIGNILYTGLKRKNTAHIQFVPNILIYLTCGEIIREIFSMEGKLTASKFIWELLQTNIFAIVTGFLDINLTVAIHNANEFRMFISLYTF